MDRSCDLCGGRSHALLYEVSGFPIVRCRDCGLVFVGREPSTAELIELYDDSYWEDAAEEGYAGYRAAESRKRLHFNSLLREIEALQAPGQMFEIGSAYGYFLDEARKRGWAVRGVEPSDHARGIAAEQGLDVAAGAFEELPVEPDSEDAVVLWDVIEHLPSPRRTLTHAHAWLRPGGLLALSTGDIGSLSARIHGRDWSLLTPPWHQYYFSRGTMRALLADVGFEVVRVQGDGVVAVDSTSSRPRLPRRLGELLRSSPVTRVARRLGAGMTMYVYARKVAR